MKRLLVPLFALVLPALLAGCGTSSSPTSSNTSSNSTSSNTSNSVHSSTNTTVAAVGAQPYQGKEKLQQFETAAKTHPKDAEAQIQAGVAAHVNGNDDLAIAYYKKAIADDPKNAVAYNNIGNIYLRDKNNPNEALTYYLKATQVDPTYGYGWWNLALCYESLNQKLKAKQVAQEGLAKVSKSDPAYKGLQATLQSLK